MSKHYRVAEQGKKHVVLSSQNVRLASYTHPSAANLFAEALEEGKNVLEASAVAAEFMKSQRRATKRMLAGGGARATVSRGRDLATRNVLALEELVRQDAHSERPKLRVGQAVGRGKHALIVTKIGTHTVQYRTGDGWGGSLQIPFLGAHGESLPSHRRALAEVGGGGASVGSRRREIAEADIAEMADMLRRYKYAEPTKSAERLRAEGMGPVELGHRIKQSSPKEERARAFPSLSYNYTFIRYLG